MTVAEQLGLSGSEHDLLAKARRQWPTWCGQQPSLDVVEDLLDLPRWLQDASKADADEVLHTLARLASPTGGDDLTAAGALAWLLLPGARVVAHRLRSLTERIDEVVAAQLWLEVRGFRWERRRKVAANIVMNTRRGVLRELEVGDHLREVDPAWARSIPIGPDAHLWEVVEALQQAIDLPADTELAEVMRWAVSEGVIERRDVELLISLAVAADEAGVTRSGCGLGGLCSGEVALVVAARWGIGASTVRRRASVSLRAISAACARIPA